MTTATINPFAPVNTGIRHDPIKVAEDTYMIRYLNGEGTPAPFYAYVNSLVILGREPVIVDTSAEAVRDQWMDQVFSLVDPKDVRWVFISHDDHDHTGNLTEVLAMCPNATLISNWFQVERLSSAMNLPLNRMRWVDDGETFDAGDRVLAAIRPPVYDSPTTRGLYDTKTGVYWAGDAFATPVFSAIENVAELPAEFYPQGFHMFQSAVAPWHTMVDQAKFNKAVDRVAELDLSAIVGAHGPVTSGTGIAKAIDLMRQLPSQDGVKLPGQEMLDQILASISQPVAA